MTNFNESDWEDPAQPIHPPSLFSPGWYFSENGQYIEANWTEDQVTEKPINQRLTLLVAIETGEIVGIRLFGVCPTIRRRGR